MYFSKVGWVEELDYTGWVDMEIRKLKLVETAPALTAAASQWPSLPA